MEIPFVGGAYTSRSSNINAQSCINMFLHIDKNDAKQQYSLFGTPGLTEFATTKYGEVRAAETLGNFIYAVVGNSVYKITSTGVSTSIGTINNSSGFVCTANNGQEILIVNGTSTGYLINSAGVLSSITDTDFVTASYCVFQDGYFIVVDKNTGNFYISGLYDGSTWDALDFATAEGRPDNLVACISNTHDLWLFGEKSTEVFYNSGDADFPFQRISGALVDLGCGAIASPCRILGNVYWLTDNFQVAVNNGYQGQIVSTSHIDYQISTYVVKSDARGFSYTVDNHVFYVLAFPTAGKTWVYDLSTGFWHEWQSYNTVSTWGRHRANCAIKFNDRWYVGDYENGKLYQLDMSTYTDNGNTIQRIRAAQTIAKERHNISFNRLEVEFEAGTGLIDGQGSDPEAMLDWSKDGGHTWSNEHWVKIGKIGEYTKRAIWNRLGMSRSRTFRLTITDPIKVVILGAYAEIEEMKA